MVLISFYYISRFTIAILPLQVSETVTYVGRRGRGRNLNRLFSDELRLPVGVALGYHLHLAQAGNSICVVKPVVKLVVKNLSE